MTDNMKKFIEFLSSQDEETSEKASKMEEDELIAFAAENGITVTPEDFAEAKKEAEAAAEGEISDDELSAVAGGKTCACVAGGGGEADAAKTRCPCSSFGAGSGPDPVWDEVCACVAWGHGKDTRGSNRCVCFVGGGGQTAG